jgi:hypothetical protein
VNFAQKLSEMMAERGVGVRQLARLVPCDAALISRLARGLQQPSVPMTSRIDSALEAGGVLVAAAKADRGTATPSTASDVERRDVLAAFGLRPVADLATRGPQHVAPELVEYFRSQLAGHYRADMFLGPLFLIPTVTEQYRLIGTLADSAVKEVRTELLGIATAYAALIGWLHQDAGNIPESAYWRSATSDMAHRCDNPDLISYALTNKAMLMTDAGKGQAVIEFGKAAMLGERRRLMPKTQIMAVVQSAHGHSLVGQRRECDVLLDDAARLVGQIGDDQVWGNACLRTPSYFEVQRATCYGRLGADSEAASLWAQILETMPTSARRDTAVFKARQAAALAAVGVPEQTKQIAEDVVRLVQDTGSARLRQELLMIPAKMSAWADTSTGRDLTEVLASIR